MVQAYLEETKGGQFRVEWTRNLLQAMIRLARPGIEVVLLELGLPELNGFKSFRAIDVAADSKVPVVILTSDESVVSRELTMGFGASGLQSVLCGARLHPIVGAWCAKCGAKVIQVRDA